MVNCRRSPGVAYGLFGTVTGGDRWKYYWNGDEENPRYLIDRRSAHRFDCGHGGAGGDGQTR